MSWLIFLAGAMFGCCVGVVLVALMAVAKHPDES